MRIIGRVPAAAFEHERSVRDQTFDFRLAGWALFQRVFGDPLRHLEFSALGALIFVNGHWFSTSLAEMTRFPLILGNHAL